MFHDLQSLISNTNSDLDLGVCFPNIDKVKITSDNVQLILQIAFRSILFDKKPSVRYSWKLLERVQESQYPLESVISPAFLEELIDYDTVRNTPGAPKLVTWILKNIDSREFKMAVKQKLVESVGSKDGVQNINNLEYIIQTLNYIRSQPDSMPQGEKLVAICERIVQQLAVLQMPKELPLITVFMNDIEAIGNLLKHVCENPPKSMVFSLQKTLYKCISDSHTMAGPGLAVVLELAGPSFIAQTVRWVLGPKEDDINLQRGLYVLCSWLLQWTRNPDLGLWVVAYMTGLEQLKKYEVLERVTMEKIDQMCVALVLPAQRQCVSPVVFHMLTSMQHTPNAFHIAIKRFVPLIPQLKKENSDSSNACLQKIVDISTALMEHFPSYNARYTMLMEAFKDSTPSEDYRNFIGQNSWSTVQEPITGPQNVPGKVGLINLGNMCYMNSVLQSLFMTQSFRNDVLRCPNTASSVIGLQTLFALLQHSKRVALTAPESLMAVRPPGFIPGLQHDSSEYMGHLLDVLHEQEKNHILQRFSNHDNQSGAECSLPTTVVQRAFGGRADTTYRCEACGGESVQADPFKDLHLSFPTSSNVENSVQALLDFYLEPEQLCGENQYWCDRCAALTDAERVFRVLEPPRHLILTLKHFRYDAKSQQRAKLFQRVRYDAEISLGISRYQLYAAVVHCGPSVDSGHYYTYASDSCGWYKFNDSWVSRSSIAELSELQPPATPYVLFYRKKDVAIESMLSIESLPGNLQSVILRDLSAFAAEQRSVCQRAATVNISRNPEDDEPPPPSVGGGDFNASNMSRFIY